MTTLVLLEYNRYLEQLSLLCIHHTADIITLGYVTKVV